MLILQLADYGTLMSESRYARLEETTSKVRCTHVYQVKSTRQRNLRGRFKSTTKKYYTNVNTQTYIRITDELH